MRRKEAISSAVSFAVRTDAKRIYFDPVHCTLGGRSVARVQQNGRRRGKKKVQQKVFKMKRGGSGRPRRCSSILLFSILAASDAVKPDSFSGVSSSAREKRCRRTITAAGRGKWNAFCSAEGGKNVPRASFLPRA